MNNQTPWRAGQYAPDEHLQPYVRLWDGAGLLLADFPVDSNGKENARRAAACVNACEGISTEQLEAMNAIDTGTLARAYDVCSELWESFGIELIGDHPIAGSEAVDALCQVAGDIEAVVQWARDAGEL